MAKSLTGNAAVEKAKAANSPIYLLNFQDTAGNWYRYATRDIAIGDWGGGQALPGGVAYSDLLKADGLGAISISMETDDGLAYGTDFEFQLQNTGAAKWSSNLATKHFTNQKVFVYLMFDDGTDYMTADMTPMGVYEIRDITVGWPDVVFSCYNAQLSAFDIEFGGNVIERNKEYRLAPESSINKTIPITYGDLDWGATVITALRQVTSLYENRNGVQFAINDTSGLVKTHDIGDISVWKNGRYWTFDILSFPPNKDDIDSGKVTVDMFTPGYFLGNTTVRPRMGDVYDDVVPTNCAQTLFIGDNDENTFDEAALGNNANVRFVFEIIDDDSLIVEPADWVRSALLYAKVETTDIVAAGNSVILSQSGRVFANQPILSVGETSYDSAFGIDAPIDLTPSYHSGYLTWAMQGKELFLIRASRVQTGMLRVYDVYMIFKILLSFDHEIDKVYISIQGSEFNSWVDEDARDNGYSEGDLIEPFPYMIESILRDFAGKTTSDIDIVSFDAAGNTINGILKDYLAAGQFPDKTKVGDILGDLAWQAGASVISINHEGKFKIIPYSPATAAYGTTFSQSNIDKETLSIKDEPLERVYTEIYLHWNLNVATGNYDNVSYVKYDGNNISSVAAQTILNNTYTNNNNHKNRLDINANFIKSKTVAIATLKALIGRYGFRHQIVTFKTGPHAIDLEVGDLINVDHTIADGAGISSSDKLEVQEITLYPTENQIEIIAVGPVQAVVGTTPTLEIAYPNGAEVLRIGEDYNILWESEGSIDNVVLDYNKSGGGWISITASTTNDGTYSWTIPNDASAEVKIKITDAGASGATDQSDAYFTIVAKPGETASFSLSNPDGDSVWQIGETYEIRWTGPNTIATVDLHASDDNGASWTITIAEGITNNGSFFWTLPSSLAADTDYKVRVQEAGGGSSDTSAAFSVITNPKVPAAPTLGAVELTVSATDDGSSPDGELIYEGEAIKVVFAFAGRVDGLFRRFEVSVYESTSAPEDGMIMSYRPAAATSYTFDSVKMLQRITDPVNTAYMVAIRAVNIASGEEYLSDWDTAQFDILYSGTTRNRDWNTQQDQEENLQSLVSGRSLFLSDGKPYGIDGDPAGPPPPPEVGDIEVGTGDDRRRMRDFWFVDTDGKSYIKKPRDKGDDILIDIDEGIYYGEMDVSAIVSTTMSVLGTLEVFGSVYFNEGHTTSLFSPAANQLRTPDDFYANALTLAGAINGVTTLNVTTVDLGTNTITDGNLTGTWVGVVDLTASGTIQGEDLIATDDLSVGDDIIGTGSDLVIRVNTADASDTKYVAITGGGAVSDTRGADIYLYGNEHGSHPGRMFLRTGAIVGAYMEFEINGTKFWMDESDFYSDSTHNLGQSGNYFATAYITTLDLGTNTITDGNLTGGWAVGASVTAGALFDIYANVNGFDPDAWLQITNPRDTAGSTYAGINFNVRPASGEGKGWFGYDQTASYGRGDFIWLLDAVADDGTVAISDLVMRLTNAGNLSVTGDVTVGDDLFVLDNGIINVGTGNDLSLYHDATNSYIANITGTLYILAKTAENAIAIVPDGAVTLYYNNVATLATTASGVDIKIAKVGVTADLNVWNTDNGNVASEARIICFSGGASAGDAVYVLGAYAVQYWHVGMDNSDADKLKIGAGSAVGTTDYLTITTAGAASFSSTLTLGGNLLMPALDIGSATSEIGHIYQADAKYHYWGNDQDAYAYHDNANFFIKNTTGTFDMWAGGNLTLRLTAASTVTVPSDLDVTGEIRIGSTTASTGTPKLDVMGIIQAVFSDETADATAKTYRIGGRHYTNAAKPFAFFTGTSNATINLLRIGGGTTSLMTAATSIEMYAAANNTTDASSATRIFLGTTTGVTLYTDLFMPGQNIGSTSSEIGNVYIGSSKVLYFGNDQSFYIYRGSTDAFVENNSGTLWLRAKAGEESIGAVPDGAVTLYYDNAAKLATATGGITITGDATASGDYLANAGYVTNLGTLQKKLLTIHAAELWVETLVAQDTTATIGGRVLVGPTTTLTSDLADDAVAIAVKHNNLADGDIVYMEADGKVEFMSIDSAAGGGGPYTYDVTRNLDGSGANAWYAGDAVFNTGAEGDGWIDLYSIQGMTGSGAGPTIVGNVRNSADYDDWSEHWAIGNLNGVYGYAADTYGVGLGRYSTTTAYVTIDATDGYRIHADNYVVAAWGNDGNITFNDSVRSRMTIGSIDLAGEQATFGLKALGDAGIWLKRGQAYDEGGWNIYVQDAGEVPDAETYDRNALLIDFSASESVRTMRGIYMLIGNSGETPVLTDRAGISMFVDGNTTGSLGTAGIDMDITQQNAAGTAYGVKMVVGVTGGSSANVYGLHLDVSNTAGAGTPYAIYVADGKTYFADGATLGAALLMPGLDIGSTASEIGHVYLGDAKYIYFGADQDAKIGHDGSNSYWDTTTGSVYIRTNVNENAIVATINGAVTLYYDNVATLATTATGISVTGDVSIGDDLFVLDNGIINVGTSNDLGFYHDGTNSYIANITGTLYILAKAAENAIVIVPDGAVTLYYNNVAAFATSATGATLTGVLTVDGILMPGQNIGSTASEIGDVYLGDSKHLYLGADQDAFLYHNGSHLFLENTTGGVYFKNDTLLGIIIADTTAAVELYFNSSKKLETTTGGVVVTGTLTITSTLSMSGQNIGTTAAEIGDVYIADSKYLYVGNSQDAYFGHDATNTILENITGILKIRPGASGDVSFFADATTGENRKVYVYGYETGVGIKNGYLTVDTGGTLNIVASDGMLLSCGASDYIAMPDVCINGDVDVLTLSITNVDDDAVINAMTLRGHVDSGAPVAGFGTSIDWDLENGAGNAYIESVAKIGVKYTDVTGAAEYTAMGFSIYANGALTEILTINSTNVAVAGNFYAGGSISAEHECCGAPAYGANDIPMLRAFDLGYLPGMPGFDELVERGVFIYRNEEHTNWSVNITRLQKIHAGGILQTHDCLMEEVAKNEVLTKRVNDLEKRLETLEGRLL